jgi:hypothetical protein
MWVLEMPAYDIFRNRKREKLSVSVLILIYFILINKEYISKRNVLSLLSFLLLLLTF